MKQRESFSKRASEKIRHGMLMHSLLGRLKRTGLTIYPYYLVREKMIPAADLPANIEPQLDSLTTGFLAPDEMEHVISDLQKFRPLHAARTVFTPG
jgi:hypothetical protein